MKSEDISASIQMTVNHSKAEYKQLGRHGLRVSVPILGSMGLGSSEWLPWVLDKEQALPLLKAAYDRGINTWDTANVYSNGVSEEIIGQAIKHYSLPRHELVILTKCYGIVGKEPGLHPDSNRSSMVQGRDYINQFGLSRTAIFNAVDRSLKRMELEYIDLLQIHRFDPDVPISETMEALHDLVKMGKVRYIGASSMWTFQFAMMQFCAEKNSWTKFISMQNHYSLLYREEEREMNKYCAINGIGLIPWSPLYRGHLARPLSASGTTTRSSEEKVKGDWYSNGLTSADQNIIKRVQEIAEKRQWSMSQVSLAWLKKRVVSPIVGCSSVVRMDEVLNMREKTLTTEEEEYLEELYTPRAVQGH